MATTIQVWKIEKLLKAQDRNITDKTESLRIPILQRGLVWSNTQKKELIESIKRGMPIGALLLYRPSDRDTVYQLVDGLQRTSAIKEYVQSPVQFLTENDEDVMGIIKEYINVLQQTGQQFNEPTLRRLILNWLKSVKNFDVDKYTAADLFYNLSDNGIQIQQNFQRNLMSGTVSGYLKNIEDRSDISGREIPIIIYTGDNLPEVFEHINTRGTKLNKFDVFAAQWESENYPLITIEEKGIKKSIKDKYTELEEDGFEIANGDGRTYTYYEFFFGFGKYLANEFRDLFKPGKKVSMADSIGFNLSALCLGLTLKEVQKLPKDITNRQIDINDLARKIIDCVEIVDSSLKPITDLKANTKDKKTSIIAKYSEYQLLSFIAKVFTTKYNENLTKKDDVDEKVEKLKRNIPFYLLYDLIDGKWDGHTDTTANYMVQQDRYFNPISKANWENLLNSYFDNELNNKTTKRETNPSVALLFLKYIYKNIISVGVNANNEQMFQLEHLTPYGRFKDKNESWAINAVSNYCLLSQELNQAKGDRTIYEYYDRTKNDPNTIIRNEQELSEIEEKWSFTTREDLEFVSDNQNFTEANYEKFLRKRFDLLKKKFYELNGIN